MTPRRVALIAAPLVLVVVVTVGATACYPTIRTCAWRASIRAVMAYPPLPFAPRATGADVRNHTMWSTSGWDPRCQGVSVYNVRRGYLGTWNQCWANPAVQGTYVDVCSAHTYNEPSGLLGYRSFWGVYKAWADTWWSQRTNVFHIVGEHRPRMDCLFAGVWPADAAVSCPWVVVVPGRGVEGGDG